jgi:PAS domain-containing protein
MEARNRANGQKPARPCWPSWALSRKGSPLTWKHVPRLTSLVVLLSSALILLGHTAAPGLMLHQLPFLASVSREAALVLVLLGFSMRLSRWESISRSAAVYARLFRLAAALFTLAALWRQVLLGVDAAPGLGVFGLTGASFLCLELMLASAKRWFRARQALTAAALLTAVAALIPSVYAFEAGREIAPALTSSPVAAVLLLLASCGRLFTLGGGGWMTVVACEHVGSSTRWMLTASFVIPIGLGWLRLLGERAGWLTPPQGLLLHVLATIGVLVGLVWWNSLRQARVLGEKERLEEARRECESSYRRFLNDLNHAVLEIDFNGQVLYANPGGAGLLRRVGGASHLVSAILRPPDRDTVSWTQLSAAFLGPASVTRRLTLSNQVDQPVELCVRLFPRIENGAPASLLVSLESGRPAPGAAPPAPAAGPSLDAALAH